MMKKKEHLLLSNPWWMDDQAVRAWTAHFASQEFKSRRSVSLRKYIFPATLRLLGNPRRN
jgi:hypothetical protein